MFTSLDTTIDTINKTIGLVVFLCILISGGISVLFRIILTPLKIKISNTKISKLDSELFDLQLLRIFHGINVESKKDAELVQLAINQGILTRKSFRLLTFGPAIGRFKRSKMELIPVAMFMLIVLTVTLNILSAIKETKYGYAIFTEGVHKVLVSPKNIYDPEDKKYITKRDCKALPKDTKKIIASACFYVTTDNPDGKDELNDAINTNNTGTIIILSISAALIFIIFAGCISYSQYLTTNNTFCKFKEEIKKKA